MASSDRDVWLGLLGAVAVLEVRGLVSLGLAPTLEELRRSGAKVASEPDGSPRLIPPAGMSERVVVAEFLGEDALVMARLFRAVGRGVAHDARVIQVAAVDERK